MLRCTAPGNRPGHCGHPIQDGHMSKPASMHYQNPLFYVLTQVLGITLLLGWLAYTVQQLPLDMSLTRFFYDAAGLDFPLRHETFVDAMCQFVVWLVPIHRKSTRLNSSQ